MEKTCVPRFPTVIPALFLFLASLAFALSTADTSEKMRFLNGVGREGLQDCRKSMFSLVNDDRGILESGRTGVGVEGGVLRMCCGLNGCRPVAFHPVRMLCSVIAAVRAAASMDAQSAFEIRPESNVAA